MTLAISTAHRAARNAALSDRVFVRDSVIEGPAPSLPTISIEV